MYRAWTQKFVCSWMIKGKASGLVFSHSVRNCIVHTRKQCLFSKFISKADFKPELWDEPVGWAVVVMTATSRKKNAKSWWPLCPKSTTCSFKSLITLYHWTHKIEISPWKFIFSVKANMMFLTLSEQNILKLVRKKIKILGRCVEVTGRSLRRIWHACHSSGCPPSPSPSDSGARSRSENFQCHFWLLYFPYIFLASFYFLI